MVAEGLAGARPGRVQFFLAPFDRDPGALQAPFIQEPVGQCGVVVAVRGAIPRALVELEFTNASGVTIHPETAKSDGSANFVLTNVPPMPTDGGFQMGQSFRVRQTVPGKAPTDFSPVVGVTPADEIGYGGLPIPELMDPNYECGWATSALNRYPGAFASLFGELLDPITGVFDPPVTKRGPYERSGRGIVVGVPASERFTEGERLTPGFLRSAVHAAARRAPECTRDRATATFGATSGGRNSAIPSGPRGNFRVGGTPRLASYGVRWQWGSPVGPA